MAYHFRCTITSQEYDKPRTVTLVDNLVAEEVNHTSDGRVCQINNDGSQTLVALLQYTMSMNTEDIWTKIMYSEGCLTHHVYYDAWIPSWKDFTLPADRGGFTLNHEKKNDNLLFLECEGQRYPVVLGSRRNRYSDTMTVCRPGEERAQPLAQIVYLDGADNWRAYDIEIYAATSRMLCMAICSLPFIWK